MQLRKLIIPLIYISTLAKCNTIEIECPVFCECDIFQKLKRAICSDRSLVSLELNIPSQAQILDLRENHIIEIGDKIFWNLGLTNLKLLNLSHNKISQIHFNGFQGLNQLKTLDLSYNAVEYFTRSWFESLATLEELYLRGNKLKNINSEPVIDIDTLRVLDISECGITKLNPHTVCSLPNLQILDISGNFLQYIEVDLITKLPNLTSLKTHNNNFNCKNRKLIAASKYIKRKEIDYTDPCIVNVDFLPKSFAINHMVQKFQRIKTSKDEDQNTSTDRPIEVKNSWIFEQADDELVNKTTVIEVCSNNVTKQGNKLKIYRGIVMDFISMSPWIAVFLIFAYGVLCGIAMTYAITICISKKKPLTIVDTETPDGSLPTRQTFSLKRLKKSNTYRGGVFYNSLKNTRRHSSREELGEDIDLDESIVINEFDLGNSTPITSRRLI